MARLDWGKARKKQLAEDYRNSPSRNIQHNYYQDNLYKTPEWKAVKELSLRLLGEECSCCGSRKTPTNLLYVCHIKNRVLYPYLALDLRNLQLLCNKCMTSHSSVDCRNAKQISVIQNYLSNKL